MAKRLFILIILLAMAAAGLYRLFGDTMTGPAVNRKETIGKQNDYSQWHKIKRTKQLKGVALVVHGLNLKPERMWPVIAELNGAGIDVLNITLRGHGKNYPVNPNLTVEQARLESFQTVTYQMWLKEIYAAYLKVRERAEKRKVPVFFVGYSLGAVMGCNLALFQPDVYYDRMILFAPALAISTEAYFLKALMPFPNMVIDSLSPTYYRSNAGTPMAAYKALFEAIANFSGQAKDKINRPTLIFIDEKDELVPFQRLSELIVQCNLDQWRVHCVTKDNNLPPGGAHHLIIDPESVGRGMWKKMADAMRAHVLMIQ